LEFASRLIYQSGVSPDVNDISVQAHHDFQRNHDED
jgi:hypothetical protein